MNNKKPVIRFKKYLEEWKQYKLKEVSTYSNGGSFENDVNNVGKYQLVTLKSVNMSGNLVNSGKYINTEVRTLKKGTLVMILSEQSPGLLGMTAQIPEDNLYVLNQRVAEIAPKINIDSYFLSMSININQRYFSRLGAGTKVQNISKSNVENYSLLVPTLSEQQLIGSFFKIIDENIALHQHALDLLKQSKKAFLQKMFPKNDENIPEIRFPGFKGHWKQTQLGSFLKLPKKKSLKVEKLNDLITLKLNLGGMYVGANRVTLKLGATKYYERRAGQFLYGKQNFFNGSMGIIPSHLDRKATSGDVPAFDIENINIDFLFTFVSRPSYWKSKEALSSGTGSKRIHEKTLQNFKIYVPSIEEQTRIGNFFKQLDDSIILQEEKLESLKQIKKAFLQKMFV